MRERIRWIGLMLFFLGGLPGRDSMRMCTFLHSPCGRYLANAVALRLANRCGRVPNAAGRSSREDLTAVEDLLANRLSAVLR